MQDTSAFEEGMKNFFAILETLIGKQAVKMIHRAIEEAGAKEPPQILFVAVNKLQELIGRRGACAIVREIGREVADKMMENHPPQEWWFVCKQALKETGYARELKSVNGRGFCVFGCMFYPYFLKPNNLEASKHPICWIATGFIEEFMRKIKKIKGVGFVKRENNCCEFKYITAENILCNYNSNREKD
jgi:predicted hydrocarbon binding protein